MRAMIGAGLAALAMALIGPAPALAQSDGIWVAPSGGFDIAFAQAGFRTESMPNGAIAFVPAAEPWPLCTVRSSSANAGRTLAVPEVDSANARLADLDSTEIQRGGMSQEWRRTRAVGAQQAVITRHRGALGQLPGVSLRWDLYVSAPTASGQGVDAVQVTCLGPFSAEASAQRNADALFGAVRRRNLAPPSAPAPVAVAPPVGARGANANANGAFVSDSGRFTLSLGNSGWRIGAPQIEPGPDARSVIVGLISPAGERLAGCSVLERTMRPAADLDQRRLNGLTAGSQPVLSASFGAQMRATSFTTRDMAGVTIARAELAPISPEATSTFASAVAFNFVNPDGTMTLAAITCSATQGAPAATPAQIRAILDSVTLR